jgi:hypothetical protein
VDDWAWRKGQSFGTILVDLERSEVVDLLPTRSAKVLAEWLAQPSEVKWSAGTAKVFTPKESVSVPPEPDRSPMAFA